MSKKFAKLKRAAHRAYGDRSGKKHKAHGTHGTTRTKGEMCPLWMRPEHRCSNCGAMSLYNYSPRDSEWMCFKCAVLLAD